jgi:Protein affecting phage T7 exclusion by the F plasmid
LWIVLLTPLVVVAVEIAVLIAVAQQIGAVWVVLITVATTLLGGYVLRTESLRSLQRLRQTMESGQLPGDESSHGGLRMLGGFALLIPGFVTDLIGLLLLLRPVRSVVRGVLLRGLVRRMSPETANQVFGPRRVRARRGKPPRPAAEPRTTGDVIDGEVLEGEIVDPPAPPRRPEEPPA